jgi:hypothetical protein
MVAHPHAGGEYTVGSSRIIFHHRFTPTRVGNTIKTKVETVLTAAGGVWDTAQTAFDDIKTKVETVMGLNSGSGIWGTIDAAWGRLPAESGVYLRAS